MPIIVRTPSAAEAAPPQAIRPNTPTFVPTLIGGDGSEWPLIRGNVLLLPGAQFAGVKNTNQLRTSPALKGARWVGERIDPDSVVLPVAVMADDWETWRATDRALFKALTSGECFLQIAAPDAGMRQMPLRFSAGGDVKMNPLAQCFAAYTLEFDAPLPLWLGDPVRRPFPQAPPNDLFPGPAFGISRTGSVSAVEHVTNPGDVESPPKYTIIGPALTWSVGVGDARVDSTVPLALGESVTVDMDPDVLEVLDGDGASVLGDMAAVSFASIPPGVDVPLTVSLTGTTEASEAIVEFPTYYRRPW